MTIGVGFRCVDGIVICSDTQITVPNSHTYYASKISTHGGISANYEWSAVFTYAGDPELMDFFKERFDEAMKVPATPKQTTESVLETIRTVIRNMADLITANPYSLYALGALSVPPDDIRMVKISQTIVNNSNSDYQYIGIGDSSLLRFLGDLVCRQYGPFYSYKSEQGVMLGAYLIRQAKKYIAEWCGGDTEAYILRPHGHYDIRNGIAKDLEERLGEIEERLQIIASMCFDGRVGNGLVEQNGTLLMELIKQSRPILAQEA